MHTSEAVRRFSSLRREQQIQFLCHFGYELTIAARDTYIPGTSDVHAPQRLRAINETQHRVFGHLLKLFDEDERRYPDDVIVSIMLEKEDKHLREQAAWAFSNAMKQIAVG